MKLEIILLLVLVGVAILMFVKCKLDCKTKEGLSHRLPTTHVLLDNAYGKYPLPSWREKLSSGDVFEDSSNRCDHCSPGCSCTRYSRGMCVCPRPPGAKDPREGYTDVFDCRKMCENVMGNGPNDICFKRCMQWKRLGYPAEGPMKPCGSDDDCGARELCVEPGPYTGGKTGYCMSDNEPGVPASDKEGFRNERCAPSYYFNENANQCQPRWQGTASAWYRPKPGPEPEVSLPGATMCGYGVGFNDPFDVKLPGFILETDQ